MGKLYMVETWELYFQVIHMGHSNKYTFPLLTSVLKLLIRPESNALKIYPKNNALGNFGKFSPFVLIMCSHYACIMFLVWHHFAHHRTFNQWILYYYRAFNQHMYMRLLSCLYRCVKSLDICLRILCTYCMSPYLYRARGLKLQPVT